MEAAVNFLHAALVRRKRPQDLTCGHCEVQRRVRLRSQIELLLLYELPADFSAAVVQRVDVRIGQTIQHVLLLGVSQ
jgi:hypothetical protein